KWRICSTSRRMRTRLFSWVMTIRSRLAPPTEEEAVLVVTRPPWDRWVAEAEEDRNRLLAAATMATTTISHRDHLRAGRHLLDRYSRSTTQERRARTASSR